MQNKGLIRILAVCLFLACAYYLSFSVRTRQYDRKAKAYAEAQATVDGVVNDSVAKVKEAFFYDSIATKKIWFGNTLKQCREKEINLGLDLKGGMNITMEVSVPEILDALSGHNTSENYKNAIAAAKEKQKKSGDDFLTLFFQSFHEVAPNAKLASIFATMELKDKVKSNMEDAEVEKVIREEVEVGVVQPNIQKLAQSGRILIELPGIKDPKRVEKLLQGSANLEFWETYELSEILPALAQINREFAAMAPEAEAVKEEAPKAEAETVKPEGDDLADLVENLNTDSAAAAANQEAQIAEYKRNNPLFALLNTPISENGQASRGPVVGAYVHYSDTAKVNEMLQSRIAKTVLPQDVRFCWSVKPVDERGSYYQVIALKAKADGRASLEGDVITDARADFSQMSVYAEVSMAMNAEGARKWQHLTGQNIGKCVAIVLDGYVYSFPKVNDEIAGGRSQITGNFTVEEAKDLANTLKSGKMPAPAHIIEESVVGPSLGREAIRAGLLSFVLGFVLILIYMIFYYGWIPGLIADAALVCNVFLLVGILSSFSAVLTLPGIAGIVLTMGMAVDANVLIYERIREELRGGKGMRKAIEDGFKGAISAIVDANVTSFLTGAILAIFGTGPIKGFAVTYMIGIISSFLTAVFITRLLLEDYCKKEDAKELSFTTKLMQNFLQNIHFDFVNARKIAYCVSGVVLIFAILGLEPHLFGKLNLGIDFSGGRNYVVRFDQSINTQEVRANLDKTFSATLEDGELFSLNVITYGNDANQVRISTNYRINDESANANDKIDSLLYAGCKAVSQSGSPFDAFYWETYTLLGDPSMTLFWTHADSLSLTATDSIRAGSTHLSLHCNLPCRVSATQDTVLLATALTMADGSVTLSLPAALDGDSITLTATRREAVCDIVTLPIARPAEPCLAAVGHHLEDTVLTVRVRNVGRQAAHGHRIQLTQDSTDREHGAQLHRSPACTIGLLEAQADTVVALPLGRMTLGAEPFEYATH